jgi:hypothetical protein
VRGFSGSRPPLSVHWGDSAQVVVAQLTRCRQRLRLLALLRHFAILGSAALVVAAGLAFVFRPELAAAAAWFGVSLAAAGGVAATTSRFATPGLRQTATLLDRRLRLEDRTVTALNLLDMRDPIAHLVVRDARRRLADLEPASVFPVERRFLRLVLLPPAAAVLVIMLALAWSALPEWDAERPVASMAGGGIGRPVSGPASATPAGATATESSRPPSTADPARAGTPEAGAGETRAVADVTEQARSSEQSNQSAAPTRATQDDAPGVRLPGPVRGPSDLASGVAAGASATGLPGEGNATRGAATGAAGPASGRNTRAGGSSPGPGTGTGGVAGSQPVALTSVVEPPQAADTAPYAARYRAAWVRAQASLTQNRVPRRFREYVRDYFSAIRPGEAE